MANPGYCVYCTRGLGYETTGVCDECDIRLVLEAEGGIAALERFLTDAAPTSLGAADEPYDWNKWTNDWIEWTDEWVQP